MDSVNEIRNLLARYCHAIDNDDLKLLESILTEDVEIIEDSSVLTPRQRLIDMIGAFQANVQQSEVIADKHLVMNSVVEVDGDHATALSDLVVVKCDSNGWRIASVGRYDDIIVRDGGEWRIKRRVIEFIGSTDKRRAQLKSEAGIPSVPVAVTSE
jgi:hypothetical protein